MICDHSAQSWFKDKEGHMHCDDCGTEIVQGAGGYWHRVEPPPAAPEPSSAWARLRQKEAKDGD